MIAPRPAAPPRRTPAATPPSRHVRALETARSRLLASGVIFALAFVVVAGRLLELTVLGPDASHDAYRGQPVLASGRADIVDRNNNILATSLPTASVYADPKEVMDVEQAIADLRRVFPELDPQVLRTRLSSPARFVWVRRGLSPEQQEQVNRLGIPGVGFVTEKRRIYPHGRAVAHVLGFTDVDGHGIAGVEQWFNSDLAQGRELRTSIDIRIQHLLRRELDGARAEFRAVGAAGMVLDVNTGEILAMVSLPDFDPNEPVLDPEDDARFNRVTKGVYEMGSTFKLFTVATGLDSNSTTLAGGYDASRPLRVARHTISDYHAKNRWLSTQEILVYSSNIGSALMAMDFGTVLQKQYLAGFGFFETAAIELPERGAPLVPSPWREINTMTVAFGHGIAVTPLHLVNGVATLVNGGIARPATLKFDPAAARAGRQVVSQRTSRQMRELMRQVVLNGTGSKADVPGYSVGGKTGTAEKLVRGRYIHNARISSFVGAYPIDNPRYAVLAMLDEPKGNKNTANYATGGWVAAPVIANLVRQMAPIVGIAPEPADVVPDGVRRAAGPAARDRQVKPQPPMFAARPVVAERTAGARAEAERDRHGQGNHLATNAQ